MGSIATWNPCSRLQHEADYPWRATRTGRQAPEEELQRQGPPAKDRAQALLDECPRFWEIETQPAEHRKLLLTLFEQIWAQNGQIVAVQPHDDFLPYFQTTQQFLQHQPAQGGDKSGSDGGPTLVRHPHRDPHSERGG